MILIWLSVLTIFITIYQDILLGFWEESKVIAPFIDEEDSTEKGKATLVPSNYFEEK